MVRTGKVWNYFVVADEKCKKAVCNYCQKTLSFKTTVTNLKNHLKQVHKKVYKEFRMDDDTNLKGGTKDALKHASEIRSYYEKEVGGCQRCVICRASRTNDLMAMMEHLKEKHPKLLAEIEQHSESGSDNDDHSENTYTEVVYLEDEVKTEAKNPEPITFKNISKRKKIEHVQTKASIYDEVPSQQPQRPTIEDEELESFVKYISCLLKQVPKDTFGKLQMDIVNLIMNAKLNSNAPQQNVVFDNIVHNVGSIDNVSMQDNENNSVPVPSIVMAQHSTPVPSGVTDVARQLLNCKD